MASLRSGWNIQRRVIGALAIRELTTRFGRENIGFLWMMAEPLLFAGLVSLIWRGMKGPEEHGVSIISFVVSGYIPLVLFRSAASRSIGLFTANASLMYHRQIKIVDFVFVRFMVEFMGHMMAYVAIAVVLIGFGLFPVPYNIGYLILGWMIYGLFTLALCLIIAPLAEMSEVVEKFMPVIVYVMIPFSGTFSMVSWTSPAVQTVLLWSPPVNAMEMMRFGIYGYDVDARFGFGVPIGASMVIIAIGLTLCRRVRRTLVVE
jgi:capsular polysaccharide transport system permease protein